MADVDLGELLRNARSRVDRELRARPRVIEKGGAFDVRSLPVRAREWHRLSEAAAVVTDLTNSTSLGADGRDFAATASVYEASTGAVVGLFQTFQADFIAIQGDGAFGLFWGYRSLPRALCAALTVVTFSREILAPGLGRKWPSRPQTGLKVGVAGSPLLVKRVGGTRHDEPVWAGHAVNFAAKAAGQAGSGELIVTRHVWDWVQGNDYLAIACPCRPGSAMWRPVMISKIPTGDSDGRLRRVPWCPTHGPEYCSKVLAGQNHRSDVTDARRQRNRSASTRSGRSTQVCPDAVRKR